MATKPKSSKTGKKSGTPRSKKGSPFLTNALSRPGVVRLPGIRSLKEKLATAKRVVAYVEESRELDTPYAQELRALEAALFGRVLTPKERRENEAAVLLNTARITKDLVESCHQTSWVREYLGGVSRQAVNSKVMENKLLAFKENGQLYFPGWQFDAEGPGKVLEGLPEVLTALNIPSFAKARWFTRPQESFKGKTPLEMLREGFVDQVIAEAYAVGAD